MKARLLMLLPLLPLLLAARQDQPERELKELTPKEGGFTVLLPGKPEEQTRKQPAPGGKGESTLRLFTADEKTAAYQVAVTTDPNLAKADADTLKTVLERVRQAAQDSLKGKLLSEKQIKLDDKHHGVEFQVEVPEGRLYRSRVYVVNDRLYQVTVLGPKEVALGKEADQVLDSFKLTK